MCILLKSTNSKLFAGSLMRIIRPGLFALAHSTGVLDDPDFTEWCSCHYLEQHTYIYPRGNAANPRFLFCWSNFWTDLTDCTAFPATVTRYRKGVRGIFTRQLGRNESRSPRLYGFCKLIHGVVLQKVYPRASNLIWESRCARNPNFVKMEDNIAGDFGRKRRVDSFGDI